MYYLGFGILNFRPPAGDFSRFTGCDLIYLFHEQESLTVR